MRTAEVLAPPRLPHRRSPARQPAALPKTHHAVSSRGLYGKALGIPFKEESDGYLHTEAVKGAKSFALWPLSQAAQSCFGKDSWPGDIPIPQAWLEFDVDSVEKATAELEARG